MLPRLRVVGPPLAQGCKSVQRQATPYLFSLNTPRFFVCLCLYMREGIRFQRGENFQECQADSERVLSHAYFSVGLFDCHLRTRRIVGHAGNNHFLTG